MLRKLVITTTVSGIMIVTALAQAQTAKEVLTPATSAKFITSQNQDQWVFSRFKGTDVIGPDNMSVGSVNDILFDGTGKIIGLVVEVGGFLGIGAKNVAMEMSVFNVVPPNMGSNDRDNDLPGARLAGTVKDPTHVKLKVSWTKDQLKEAPSFAYFEPSAPATTGSATPSNPPGK